MSTKIYEAWRLPAGRLNEFLDGMRRGMINNVRERVARLMGSIIPKVAEKKAAELYPKDLKGFRKEKLRYARFYIVIELAREAAERLERSVVTDLECGLNIWIRGRFAYAIPYGERWTRHGFWIPNWAKEYGYWDNTDRPDKITRRQWDARRQTWGRVCLANWNGRRLQHEVVSMRKHDPASQILLEGEIFPNRFMGMKVR